MSFTAFDRNFDRLHTGSRPVPEASAEQSGTFSGTWVASGKLQPFHFAEGREVANFKLAGHVSLKDEVDEVVDYWAECAGLSNSAAGSSVRCVRRSLKGGRHTVFSAANRLKKVSR